MLYDQILCFLHNRCIYMIKKHLPWLIRHFVSNKKKKKRLYIKLQNRVKRNIDMTVYHVVYVNLVRNN